MAKVLIVDDDPSILELLQFLVGKQGHEVLTATNGKIGLALAQSQKPDGIVLDVMMPEMDGFGMSAALFKDPEMRNIPILILTAKGTSREIFKLVPNVRGYMDKPFDPPDFLKNLKQLLIKVV